MGKFMRLIKWVFSYGKLLGLLFAFSIFQYVQIGQVSWVTDTFRWTEQSATEFFHDPGTSLTQAGETLTSYSARATHIVSQATLPSAIAGTNAEISWSERFEGRVVKVTDGDTITIVNGDNNEHRVRLHGIDTPEYKQPYSRAAQRALAEMVAGKNVSVEVKDSDRYGRTVGIVWIADTNANLEMVRQGYAWWYKKYARFESSLEQAELHARERGIGLWAEPDPVPPWDWRRRNR